MDTKEYSVFSKFEIPNKFIEYQLDPLQYYVIDKHLIPTKDKYFIHGVPKIKSFEYLMTKLDVDENQFITSEGIEQLDQIIRDYDLFIE